MQLFDKTILGAIQLKNRFALAPMTTYSGNANLTPSKEEIEYLRLRSKGPAMVISPAICVNKNGQAFVNQMSLIDDEKIAPMKVLVDAIKASGGVPIAQLHHGGRMNDPVIFENKQDIVAPSAVRAPRGDKVTPRAMTIDEIEMTVEDFKQAALRAIKAGYQGIELHGANTYLLQQFFSPHSNKRNDAYGGTFEKRLRFIEAVIDATQEVIATHAGDQFILGYRFSPEEIEADGITMDLTLRFIDFLKTKNLDYLHVSLRRYDQGSMRNESNQEPLVTQLKQRIDGRAPLMGAGGVNDRQTAEAALAQGLDYIAVGFSLLTDPDFVEKVKNDQPISKHINSETLPSNLYQRLYKNREHFMKNGFTF